MSSRPSSRSASASPRARSSSTPRRSRTAASTPSPSASRSATSSSAVSPSVGASPRPVRLSYREEHCWAARADPVVPLPIAQRVLRCPPLRHGVGRQGLRGHRLGQAPCRPRQVDEVHRRLHDSLWPAGPRLCRRGDPPRPHASGRPRHQGQDHEALGPRGSPWPVQAPPGRRHECVLPPSFPFHSFSRSSP